MISGPTNLKINETYESDALKINFEGIQQRDEQNFKAIIGKFVEEHNGGQTDIMQPELRIYNQPNIITSEADIKTTLFSDNFLVFNILKDDGYYNVRYQYKPVMIWIWISTILISIGGLLLSLIHI